jgi:hypothetical protein
MGLATGAEAFVPTVFFLAAAGALVGAGTVGAGFFNAGDAVLLAFADLRPVATGVASTLAGRGAATGTALRGGGFFGLSFFAAAGFLVVTMKFPLEW